MAEQQVVHRPERALGAGRLGRLGRELGARVHVGQRQMAPDVAEVGVGQQLPDDRLGLTAVGALEVAELDQRDRRVRRTADVVAVRVDLGDQVLDQLRIAQQCAGIAPAGGSSAVSR